MAFQFGIDHLLNQSALIDRLKSARVGLVAHPASVTGDNRHSLDTLIAAGCKVVKAFGPQHGMRGDKQDNMVETADETDPQYGIPVFSLYGEVRRRPLVLADNWRLFRQAQRLGFRLSYFFESCLIFSIINLNFELLNLPVIPIEADKS